MAQRYSSLEWTYSPEFVEGKDLALSLHHLFLDLFNSLQGFRMGLPKKKFSFIFYFEPRNDIYPREFQFNEPTNIQTENFLRDEYSLLLRKALTKFVFIGFKLLEQAITKDRMIGKNGFTQACLEALWDWTLYLLNVTVQVQLSPEDTRTPEQVTKNLTTPGKVTLGPILLFWNETEIYRLYRECTPDLAWLTNGIKVDSLNITNEDQLRPLNRLPNGTYVLLFDVNLTTNRDYIFVPTELKKYIEYSIQLPKRPYYTREIVTAISDELQNIQKFMAVGVPYEAIDRNLTVKIRIGSVIPPRPTNFYAMF